MDVSVVGKIIDNIHCIPQCKISYTCSTHNSLCELDPVPEPETLSYKN